MGETEAPSQLMVFPAENFHNPAKQQAPIVVYDWFTCAAGTAALTHTFQFDQ
jgi:hypothetical protein